MALEARTPLTQLPGIGPAKARALARLGLARLGDLLDHFPQRYEDRRRCWAIRQAPLDQPCCVSAMVAEVPRLSRVRKGLELVKVKAVDHTGVLHLTFFNQAYLKNALSPGVTYVFYGKVEELGRARRRERLARRVLVAVLILALVGVGAWGVHLWSTPKSMEVTEVLVIGREPS